ELFAGGVGGIRNDQLETFGGLQRAEQVALEEAEAPDRSEAERVVSCHGEGVFAFVESGGLPSGTFASKGHGDRAASGSDVEGSSGQTPRSRAGERHIDERFGLGTWDEDPSIDPKLATVELLFPEDIRGWFTASAPFDQGAKAGE